MSRTRFASIFAALVVGILGMGIATQAASAEVITNDWLPAGTTIDNPCEAGSTPISLSGLQHHVWYTTPDGGLAMNIQAHLTGTDADGIRYIANLQRHMEHPSYPALMPFSDTFTQNLVSRGSTVNARIIMTFDLYPLNPVVTVVACLGQE